MPILSRCNTFIHAKCALCARTYSVCDAAGVRTFYAHRRRFRKDLCRICRFAQVVGYFEYQCAGCNGYVRGTLDQLVDCLNVHTLALCRSCMEGYYGAYDENNEAMMIAIEVIKNKTFRKEPRRYPHYLEFQKEEAAYGPAVRNLTKRNYHRFKNQLNPKNLPITPSGKNGGYQVDHIVPVSLCFKCSVTVPAAAAPENLQVIPWYLNAIRGAKVSPRGDYRSQR